VHPGRVEGLAPGLYYYHPRHHRLILLAAGAHLDRTAYAEVNRSVFDSSAFALLLVTRMAAITPVYGELARDFSMLEAGYMGELLMETAAATGIGLCPIGDLGFDNVRPSLCLDGDHRLVHSFLGGPLPAVDAGPVPAVVPHTHQTSALPPPVAPSMERRLTELELLELKLSEPGLRRDVAGRAEVALPAPVEQGLELFAERRSHRELLAEPVGRGDLEELLGALAAEERTETGGQRYRYPSAGDLYMVRAYVHVKPGRVDGLEAGVYRYDPHHRSLQPVTPGAAMDRGVHAEVNQPVFDQAAFTLFLLAKTGAVVSRYGGLARDFCLLEAGYMGQLLMTVAPDNGLGLCPVGSVDFAAIAGSFQPAPDQIFVHCLLGGAVAQRGTHARVRADRDALPQILRQRLLEKLPEHMVPTAWMVLDALPLSANGKVDRRALPDPEQVKGPAQEVYVAPDSDLGRLIVKIWQEELQIERVGMYDNFFELGGNSLHMVRVHSRLTGELGREIRITELFKHSTVAALAQELGAAAAARPSFDSQREQAAKQRRAIERQRQRRQEKSTNEH
jgi:SagB-type dehydrogenase family enzyme